MRKHKHPCRVTRLSLRLERALDWLFGVRGRGDRVRHVPFRHLDRDLVGMLIKPDGTVTLDREAHLMLEIERLDRILGESLGHLELHDPKSADKIESFWATGKLTHAGLVSNVKDPPVEASFACWPQPTSKKA